MNKLPDKKNRVIMLADCQSFYTSVEKAAHPEYFDQPVVVAGDPARRSGIILAACPLAKKHGITTAERLGEALGKCPDLIVIRPRMQEYIRVSLEITAIMQTYTDLVEPYSIDEQFLDITGSQELFGPPEEIARSLQEKILKDTGIYIRVGISENKVLAKMACDNYAKKKPSGIWTLAANDIEAMLWPLPIHQMFMVGSRMTKHLTRMGIHTIGDLAKVPLSRLRAKWGVNGEVLWMIANGKDYSPVKPNTHNTQKGIGHQMTLPYDYCTLEEIRIPLLELTELVCQRTRRKGFMGYVVSVGCRGADFNKSTGFHRQKKLAEPTNLTSEVYQTVMSLFTKHWNGAPIRSIGVSLTDLVSDQIVQLDLFHDRERELALEKAADQIKLKYGNAAIMRASSLQAAGQARDRAQKIGGHYK
ncbi:DNA polymerase IV [Paenibacillus aquistagni]|uniref:DNA polymerase IV n=1 Tax=Paenibacillus aquistagni TaxID=1852522 RepID=UPI000B50C75D|nr:DNA polymerase IV [Paenibacillus aquistagni]NMM51336.1 DNA polymerase IV [Paenibacillus aquistagni]